MKPARLKILLPFVVVLLGVVVTAALVRGRRPPERAARVTPPPMVRVQPVEFGEARLDVRSQGQVAPRTETMLVAAVAGQIVDVSTSLVAGGFFGENETLARIDPTDYRLAVKTAEAAVARAELALAREEKEAEIARRDWEGLGTGEPSALVLREPQLAEARAALASAKASVEKASTDLGRTRVRVPYAGRVREKFVDVGQFVAPGTAIAQVYAVDAAEIRLAVPANEIGFLDLPLGGGAADSTGPRVTLRADYGGKSNEWTGRIVRTEGQIDPQTRMVHVVARVEDPFTAGGGGGGAPLAVGLFVEATIEGRTVRDVVVLPRSALRGEDGVLIVDEENRLHPRTVEVLRVDREWAVISGGLDAGQVVCLSPIEVAVDGMAVRVQRPDGVGMAANPPAAAEPGGAE